MVNESDGEWVRLAEAAQRLGASDSTLRRRIKRGQLDARQVPTQHGPTWEVWLGVPEHVATSLVVSSPPADSSVLGDLVRELLAEVQRLTERAVCAEEQLRVLEVATALQGAPEGPQRADGLEMGEMTLCSLSKRHGERGGGSGEIPRAVASQTTETAVAPPANHARACLGSHLGARRPAARGDSGGAGCRGGSGVLQLSGVSVPIKRRRRIVTASQTRSERKSPAR
jgi:hypothetical protein